MPTNTRGAGILSGFGQGLQQGAPNAANIYLAQKQQKLKEDELKYKVGLNQGQTAETANPTVLTANDLYGTTPQADATDASFGSTIATATDPQTQIVPNTGDSGIATQVDPVFGNRTPEEVGRAQGALVARRKVLHEQLNAGKEAYDKVVAEGKRLTNTMNDNEDHINTIKETLATKFEDVKNANKARPISDAAAWDEVAASEPDFRQLFINRAYYEKQAKRITQDAGVARGQLLSAASDEEGNISNPYLHKILSIYSDPKATEQQKAVMMETINAFPGITNMYNRKGKVQGPPTSMSKQNQGASALAPTQNPQQGIVSNQALPNSGVSVLSPSQQIAR